MSRGGQNKAPLQIEHVSLIHIPHSLMVNSMSRLSYSIEHIGLSASDTEALAQWYVETLGGEICFQNDDTPPAVFVELPGGLILEIYPCAVSDSMVQNNSLQGFRHLALQVDSIADAKAELEAKGIEFPDDTRHAGGGGTVLFFKDLEGNLIHFVERPDGSQFALDRP